MHPARRLEPTLRLHARERSPVRILHRAFWDADGDPCKLLDGFRFTVPPCDGTVRLAVLAINLLKPLREREADGIA